MWPLWQLSRPSSPHHLIDATQTPTALQLLSFIPACDVGALMDSAAGRTGVGALARTSSRSSDTEATD